MGRKRKQESPIRITRDEWEEALPHLFLGDVKRMPYMQGLYDYCVTHHEYLDNIMLYYIADHQAEFLPHPKDMKWETPFPYDYEHLLKAVRHHMLSEEELKVHYDTPNLERQQQEGFARTQAEIDHYINLAPHTRGTQVLVDE